MTPHTLEADPRWKSLGEVCSWLNRLEDALASSSDPHHAFVCAYRLATRSIEDRLARGLFHDAQGIVHYATTFAELYRQARGGIRREAPTGTPNAWRIAFEVSGASPSASFASLMLGISAHIHRDLGIAVLAAGLDVDSERCLEDHVLVNDALRDATPAIRRAVVRTHFPRPALASALFGPWIDRAVHRSVCKARSAGWRDARRLAHARSEVERSAILRGIARRASDVALAIRARARSPMRCIALLGAAGDAEAAST